VALIWALSRSPDSSMALDRHPQDPQEPGPDQEPAGESSLDQILGPDSKRSEGGCGRELEQFPRCRPKNPAARDAWTASVDDQAGPGPLRAGDRCDVVRPLGLTHLNLTKVATSQPPDEQLDQETPRTCIDVPEPHPGTSRSARSDGHVYRTRRSDHSGMGRSGTDLRSG
jgi:hypothetical protein